MLMEMINRFTGKPLQFLSAMFRSKAMEYFGNPNLPTVREEIFKLRWDNSGMARYGLKFQDCLNPHLQEVSEAVERLPPDVKEARDFRIARAMLLNMQKQHLPKAEWSTWEFAKEPYLSMALTDVENEIKEQVEWERKYGY